MGNRLYSGHLGNVGLLLSCLFLVACISNQPVVDVRSVKGTGASQIYKAPKENVWEAIPQILKDVDLATPFHLTLLSDNKLDSYILVQITHAVPWYVCGGQGDVAIFIEAAEDAYTRVEVVSRTNSPTPLLCWGIVWDWEHIILNQLGKKFKS